MKKQGIKKIFRFIFIVLVLAGVYFYDEYFDDATDNIKSKVGSVVNYNVDNLEIHYIDVGQADCILIRYLDNNVLIDAGNNEDGMLLVKYFEDMGISKFNYVIGTHAHEDHIGGMDNIIASFDIDHFYMPNVITTTKTFEDVLDSLDKNNVKFETPTVDYSFDVGELNFAVIYIGSDSTDLNDSSIVLKMSYKDTSYLFTGDATSKVERQILDKDIESTVLKVGHHGSQYSSTAQFLKKVSPQYAIIQVGKNNSYGHPKDITMKKLERIGAQIYRTDQDGTIVLTSDGNNISFKTVQTNTNGG